MASIALYSVINKASEESQVLDDIIIPTVRVVQVRWYSYR